jgi:polysaccharide export outer membrane protein
MFFHKTLTMPFLAAFVVGIVAIVAVAAGAAEPTPAPPSSPTAAPESYRLGAGDRVRVSVFGEKDLSGTFEVASDRTMALPLIGSVDAGGLTARELESLVEQKLLDGYLKEPRVNAEVVNYRPFYIIGEVQKPGSYAYVSNITVLNAVAMGGGFTYRARQSRMFMTRATDPERKEKAVSPDTAVMPGDVIRVPERYF